MSVSNSARLDSIQHSRSGLIDIVDSGSSSNETKLDLERDLSRGELNPISNEQRLDWTLESVVSAR